MLVGTDGIGLPWFVKGKRWGGVPSFIKEHQSANLSLSKTCFIFVWKIVRTLLPVVDKDTTSQNQFLSLCFTNEKL
jgi:hypothetical protein